MDLQHREQGAIDAKIFTILVASGLVVLASIVFFIFEGSSWSRWWWLVPLAIAISVASAALDVFTKLDRMVNRFRDQLKETDSLQERRYKAESFIQEFFRASGELVFHQLRLTGLAARQAHTAKAALLNGGMGSSDRFDSPSAVVKVCEEFAALLKQCEDDIRIKEARLKYLCELAASQGFMEPGRTSADWEKYMWSSALSE